MIYPACLLQAHSDQFACPVAVRLHIHNRLLGDLIEENTYKQRLHMLVCYPVTHTVDLYLHPHFPIRHKHYQPAFSQ